jgi:MFS transporter, Spinster family, sphingosine-1-phosphate transporter
MVSGIVGVPLGATLAQRLRVNYPRADPLICATGLLISAPLLFAASLFAASNSILCFTLVFLGEVALNLNWSIVADILLVSLKRNFFLFKNIY